MRYAIFCGREDRTLLDICMRSILTCDMAAEITVLEPDSGPLMVAKCKAWLKALGEPTVFLDDDIVVQRPLNPPADSPVILTCREIEGLHPYNTGVVWADERARPFFEDVLAFCEGLPDDRKAWYGDQDAVAALAANHPHAEVPVDPWNWTPDHFGELRQELSNPTRPVIHFKGNRKGWMRWYDKQISVSERSDRAA